MTGIVGNYKKSRINIVNEVRRNCGTNHSKFFDILRLNCKVVIVPIHGVHGDVLSKVYSTAQHIQQIQHLKQLSFLVLGTFKTLFSILKYCITCCSYSTLLYSMTSYASWDQCCCTCIKPMPTKTSFFSFKIYLLIERVIEKDLLLPILSPNDCNDTGGARPDRGLHVISGPQST